MISFCKEGEIPKNGINFYHLHDKSSFGFKIRIGLRLFICRLSKITKNLHLSYTKAVDEIDINWANNDIDKLK